MLGTLAWALAENKNCAGEAGSFRYACLWEGGAEKGKVRLTRSLLVSVHLPTTMHICFRTMKPFRGTNRE